MIVKDQSCNESRIHKDDGALNWRQKDIATLSSIHSSYWTMDGFCGLAQWSHILAVLVQQKLRPVNDDEDSDQATHCYSEPLRRVLMPDEPCCVKCISRFLLEDV